MTWPDLMDKLNQAIGLDPNTLGTSTIQAHVRQRMARTGCPTPGDYAQYLQAHPGELAHLIDDIVVGETWFFRDDRPFAYLAEHIASLRAQQPGRTFRLLSAPCATGEEPYSMAMALLDAGIPPQCLVIDAADISSRFLAHAQRGWYASHAFRSRSGGWQSRYFSPADGGYQIDRRVSRCVRWHQVNLTTPAFWQNPGRYDVVFCRNLLIYLDTAARRRVVGWIHHALNEQGLLFAGHAEAMDSIDERFVAVRRGGSFAYAKKQASCLVSDHSPSRLGIAPIATSSVQAHRPGRDTRIKAESAATSPAISPAWRPPLPTGAEDDALARAVRLADRGQLHEAVLACESYIQAHGPAAQAYAIIGMACMAMDDFSAAESAFTRALYLDPGHLESLTHLAILCDRTGRADRAAVLRQRARRVTQETSL